MRSAELANLAGVSVRALRHYNQTGLLDEPERDHNNYRRYSVHDLVRVLRIRQLASLGMALDQMKPLLEDQGQDTAALLEELDKNLAAQVERIQEQRRLVARLKELSLPPDLPLEFAQFFKAYADQGAPDRLMRIDRDQTVLLAGLANPEDTAKLAEAYEALTTDADWFPAVIEMGKQFDQLDPETPEDKLDEIATELAAFLAPIAAQLNHEGEEMLTPAAADLFFQHASDLMNPAQSRLLDLIEKKLEAINQASGGGRIKQAD